MVVVPDVIPFTEPEAFTVATTVLVLLHTPPVVASVNAIDAPMQTEVGPEIEVGASATV